jgi:hypothetical protein
MRYGTLVATRVQELSGQGRLEVRAVAKLDADQELARWQAQQLAVRIDKAIREVLGLPPGSAPARPAVQPAGRPQLDHPRTITGVVLRG